MGAGTWERLLEKLMFELLTFTSRPSKAQQMGANAMFLRAHFIKTPPREERHHDDAHFTDE